jgi:hypothetical protein
MEYKNNYGNCGIFRGPFGYCRKQLQFSDFNFGGKIKSKKIKSKKQKKRSKNTKLINNL